MSRRCLACGTWTCRECGWQRNRANRLPWVTHRCAKCRSANGTMVGTLHQSMQVTQDHNRIYFDVLSRREGQED